MTINCIPTSSVASGMYVVSVPGTLALQALPNNIDDTRQNMQDIHAKKLKKNCFEGIAFGRNPTRV